MRTLKALGAAAAAFSAAWRPGRPADRLGHVVEAAGKTIDADDDQWRRAGASRRDLPATTQARMQELAHWLWRQNPLANWLIEIRLAYLLGEGVELQAEDEQVREILEEWWRDPINNWPVKLAQRVRQLMIFGELCLPTFVNDITRRVRHGYLDPSTIERVITDPDNAEQPIGVVTAADAMTVKRFYRVIVNGDDEDLFSPETRRMRESYQDGECFLIRLNALSNASRGTSDLLATADWLDNFDGALWAELERWEQLRAFIWDITLKGATPDAVEERARKIHAPAPGSTRVHNDSEAWQAIAPTLNAEDGSGFARLFRNYILGNAGLPEHWYGGGGDVNRATAGEMDEPTYKLLAMRQRALGAELQEIGRYVIRRRLELTGQTYDEARHGFTVVWPPLTAPDTTKFAAALQQVIAAAAVAVDRGLLSEPTAVALIALLAGQLGVEIDPADELARAREEAAARRAEDSFGALEEDDEAGPGPG